MKTIYVLCVLAVLCTMSALADDCPPCDPEAGCQRVGCPCQQGTVPYRPGRHPEQLIVAGCAECPPVTVCRADLIRLKCVAERQCSEEEKNTYVLDEFTQSLLKQ